MSHSIVRRLRPYLFTRYRALQHQPQTRYFSSARCLQSDANEREVTNDYKRRVAQLEETQGSLEECYPRLDDTIRAQRTTIPDFRTTYKGLLRPGQTNEKYTVVVAGM